MTYRMYGVFIASLSAVALMLAANETFGGSGGAHVGGVAPAPPISHPPVAGSPRHHRGSNVGGLWPAAGGYFYGPSYADPMVADVTRPVSGDIHYTYTYDVPWDAVHRYPPPPVTPPATVFRTYVPGCAAQTVTVPWGDGKEQTVNIVRC
jgi:hypothetical protein